ncbi:hypothetical protein AAFC00_000254 [Neodothiora populina]|uniref:Uncharacterized protein n=1 Tax=Neodothiora populina TaxID=2781224 RepID=A0ABR3P292_9PEZI
MSNRDSKRFAVLINPLETPLQPVPESPTVTSHAEGQSADCSNGASVLQPQTTMSTASSPPTSSYRARSQSQSFSSRPRKSSMRRQAPTGLQMDANRLGVPKKPLRDFPSPGSAPKGTRIFDASAVAETKGVETAQPGWAVDSRTQNKLEDEHYKEEHPEEVENMGQKIQRSLSTVKRSASLSVKRAKSLRRPRGNSSSAGAHQQIDEDMPMPPPPFEDEDAKMVRMSVIKPHDD